MITKELANTIVKAFKEKNGPTLSHLEVMAMTKLMTDCYQVYGIQKGDVTFLAWVSDSGELVTVKTQCW